MEIERNSKTLSNKELENLANSLLAQGDRRKAKAYFHQLVRNDPQNKDVLLSLSSIYIEDNQIDEAFSTLMEIKNHLTDEVRNDPAFIFRYRYTLAIAHIKRGEHHKGHNFLSKLISEDPSFSPAYAALAGNYVKLNKAQTAEFVAKRGIEKSGEDPTLFNILGIISRGRGSLDIAETWFNKALEKDPNHISSLVNRASINVIRFEYESASKDIGKALSLNPFSVDALVLASVILHKQEELDAARDILYKVIDLDPENAGARFNLALIEEKLDQRTTARQLLEEVLQLEIQNSSLREKAKLKLVDLAPYSE
jgi:tetratricopeptide (TPR) repeat protein